MKIGMPEDMPMKQTRRISAQKLKHLAKRFEIRSDGSTNIHRSDVLEETSEGCIMGRIILSGIICILDSLFISFQSKFHFLTVKST